jgi:hypothetical protein
VLIYLTRSDSSYNLYNSKLHLLHCVLSCTAWKILHKILLSNTPSALSYAFVSVQVSEACRMLLLALQVRVSYSVILWTGNICLLFDLQNP